MYKLRGKGGCSRLGSGGKVLTLLKEFSEALSKEFSGAVRPENCVEIVESLCRERIRDFIVNRLGHLRNGDFFALRRVLTKETNILNPDAVFIEKSTLSGAATKSDRKKKSEMGRDS